MLPRKLALIDDDKEFTEYLAQYLREQGVAVDVYGDANDLLNSGQSKNYDFYIVDLMMPGLDGTDLIRVLRQRSQAGVLVVSGKLAPDVFKQVVEAGADMYLVKPVQFEQVAIALRAVHRRVDTPVMNGSTLATWTLDRQSGQLVAPDGARVDLSEGDLAVMECFIEAQGEPVPREVLRLRLGRPEHSEVDDGLNATIYRLRRRIERATPMLVPLQSRSRVGYVFRAPLSVTS